MPVKNRPKFIDKNVYLLIGEALVAFVAGVSRFHRASENGS